MALSTASALRPLRAIERVTFPGVNPEVARISVGMIGEVPSHAGKEQLLERVSELERLLVAARAAVEAI